LAGKRNPMYGRSPGHGKHSRLTTPWQGEIKLRSSWEQDVAKQLLERKEQFLYEPERFTLGPGLTYLPDFYLTRLDLYLEVKGWFKERDQQIAKLFPKRLVWIRMPEMKRLSSFLSELLADDSGAAGSGI
jgi:hypothetical protein